MVSETDIEKMDSSQQLKSAAYDYNWDDGFSVPLSLANHPKCDLGVALELFWLSEAIIWLTGEIEPGDWNADWCNFCELLTTRIMEGHYLIGACEFSTPLTRTQIYKYRKQGIPEVYLSSIVPEK